MTEIATALLLAVRVVLPGWVWTPPQRHPLEGPGDTGAAVARAGRAIALGLVLNLLPALCVAQSHGWSPQADWGLWVLVVLAGLLRRRWSPAGTVRDALYAVGFLTAVTAVVLWLPPRSEWFAGGWDPGLYQNAAVVVAEAGGFAPRTDSVYAALSAAERSLFGPQAFPAVPIEAATGAIQHYFFQLTPICGALFYRLGGLGLLSRMSQVLAWMGLPVLFAMAGALGVTGCRRGVLLLAWCLSPLWWYQQAVPTTEMLQVLLFCGATAWYLDAERRGDAFPLGAALLLAAIGVNHFGFPPLIAIVLLAVAAAESFAQRPGRTGRLLTCGAALAAGLAWDLAFSSVTVARLERKDGVLPLILITFAVCLAAGIGISRWRIDPRLAARVGGAARHVARAAGGLLILFAALVAWPPAATGVIRPAEAIPLLGQWLLRFERFVLFHGPAWCFLLGLGAIVMAHDYEPRERRTRVLAVALGGVILLLLLNPGIAPLYPWAFRRYVVFLLPLTALVLGCGLTDPPPGWWRFHEASKAFSSVAVAVLLLVGVRASRPAAAVGEYVGYRAALATLDRSVLDGDVVVADDPRPGTPLLLMFGRDVLDGSRLWKSRDPEYQGRYLAMLRRLQVEEGRRIVWLTSTEEGLGLYPPAIGATMPLTAPAAVDYRTVTQSARADGFATRAVRNVFQLHLWP